MAVRINNNTAGEVDSQQQQQQSNTLSGGGVFKYGVERLETDRTLHGVALDVVQRLPTFCDETFPLQKKSLAFLVPYGYGSTRRTFHQAVRRPQAETQENSNQSQNDTIKPQQNRKADTAWDYAQTNRVAPKKTEIDQNAPPIFETQATAVTFSEFKTPDGNPLDFTLETISTALSADPSTIELSFTPLIPLNKKTFDIDPADQQLFSSRPVFVNPLEGVNSFSYGTSPCGEYDFAGFVFMMNPSQISLSTKANYSEAETWADISQGRAVQWNNNDNVEMSISGVELPGLTFKRVVQPIEDKLFSLIFSPGDNGIEPTVWSFVWGERIFEPCVITDVSVKETGWYKGRTVIASFNLSLKKVPEWQVNDGFDVVALINENLQRNLERDRAANAGDPLPEKGTDTNNIDNPDPARTVNTKIDLSGCPEKGKKCANPQALLDLQALYQKNQRPLPSSTLNKVAYQYLDLCLNTANNRGGEKFDAATREDPCTWSRCCKAYEELVRLSEETEGTPQDTNVPLNPTGANITENQISWDDLLRKSREALIISIDKFTEIYGLPIEATEGIFGSKSENTVDRVAEIFNAYATSVGGSSSWGRIFETWAELQLSAAPEFATQVGIASKISTGLGAVKVVDGESFLENTHYEVLINNIILSKSGGSSFASTLANFQQNVYAPLASFLSVDGGTGIDGVRRVSLGDTIQHRSQDFDRTVIEFSVKGGFFNTVAQVPSSDAVRREYVRLASRIGEWYYDLYRIICTRDGLKRALNIVDEEDLTTKYGLTPQKRR